MKIYNTLTRKKHEFKPINAGKVNMYVCGVTVYDYTHIGHAKSYIQFDVIVRYLRTKYDVFYLQNVTDIDDKIIIRANKEKKDWKEIVENYRQAYFDDMKALNVNAVSKYVNATDYIKEMVEHINKLIDKGIAYELNDGIYFDISKFKKYGKLSGQNLEALKQHRIEPNPDKRNAGDFVLWKKQKPGEPAWNSPWGKGRPGWHIECSAMNTKYFGEAFDIHGGGGDLIFPHHEAEIAQVEALTKKPFVKIWMHNGFLVVNKEKMSKSLGNFITIMDAVNKWGAMAVRYLFATSHYRAQIDFNEESLMAAKNSYETIYNSVINLRERIKNAEKREMESKFIKQLNAFHKEMDDDFNTPRATAVLFDTIKKINAYKGNKTLESGLNAVSQMLEVLGLEVKEVAVPRQVMNLINERESARKQKNWKEADRLREVINSKGFAVDDSDKGPIIKKSQ